MLLKTKYVQFKDRKILVYVVERIRDKMRGATIFDKPPQNIDGMLFVGYNAIAKDVWMKGMKFPLDIYFLDKDMNIIKSYENAQPCNNFLGIGCPKYKAGKKYYYILELWR